MCCPVGRLNYDSMNKEYGSVGICREAMIGWFGTGEEDMVDGTEEREAQAEVEEPASWACECEVESSVTRYE